ncbi:MAG: Fibronectin type domain [Bacteroidetes bacterium]|nr:Fibronectin type domain [Bacteroidota bacterium]
MKTRIILWAVLATLFSFVSCDNDENYQDKNILGKPEVTVANVKESSAVVTWKSVDNANVYVYRINNGDEQTTENNTIQLTGLDTEKTYTIDVKAQKSGSLYFEDSEFSQASFTTTSHVVVYRIATFADDWDTWYYEYNDNGTVKRVYRLYDGQLDREWVFAYSGSSVSVTGKDTYTMTLNDKGYVATFITGQDTYAYTYNDNGNMIKVEKNGNIYSNAVIENGNIIKWSKFTDGVEQFKVQTYSEVPNVGNTHCIYSERAGISHWLVETGLFGNASAYCHKTSGWDYSSVAAAYSFEYDQNGCIKKEIKDYAGSIENFSYTYYAE